MVPQVLPLRDIEADALSRRGHLLTLSAQHFDLCLLYTSIGTDTDFRFIKKMADDLPNAGFCHFPSLRVSDEAIYEALLTSELCDWLRKL